MAYWALERKKHDETFLIEYREDDKNLRFWEHTFESFEEETYAVFDKYLRKDKVFIDVGSWIGATTMYGSRKSKHVYCIEADKKAFLDMSRNMALNCEPNYTLLNKAIYHIDNIEINFGKNKFLPNASLNESTSQIQIDSTSGNDSYAIETISLSSLLKTYEIDPTQISLIKVDIEGGEEYILNDLHKIHKDYKIPLYVSFHVSWWKNKTLDRFDWLTASQKQSIEKEPFVSLLFND